MAPLTEEAMEKAKVLLKARKDVCIFTNASDSINGWLEKSTPSSISEVYHPLASSPTAKTPVVSPSPQKAAITEELPAGKIKTESVLPECGHSTPSLASFTTSPIKVEPPALDEQGEISLSPERPQPIWAIAPIAAP